MTQKPLPQVIDEWAEAIARLAAHAPPEQVEQLRQATGDLLEALCTAVTTMAAHEALGGARRLVALEAAHDSDLSRIELLEERTARQGVL